MLARPARPNVWRISKGEAIRVAELAFWLPGARKQLLAQDLSTQAVEIDKMAAEMESMGRLLKAHDSVKLDMQVTCAIHAASRFRRPRRSPALGPACTTAEAQIAHGGESLTLQHMWSRAS
jgi:hypothetical protein